MPQATYTPLANITLGSSASSVTFSNIPNTYRDLILVFQGTKAGSGESHLQVRANSDSGSNYPRVIMQGGSGGPDSNYSTGVTGMQMGYTPSGAPTFFSTLQIFDYSVTDKHKSYLTRFSRNADVAEAIAGRWASTSTITSLTILFAQSSSENIASGAVISLYGVIA